MSDTIDETETEDQEKTMQLNSDICYHGETLAYGESIYDFKHTRVEFSNPVRVCNDSGQVVGYASLYHQEAEAFYMAPRTVADVSLSWHTPERLSLQVGQPHWVVPVGVLEVFPYATGQTGRLDLAGSRVQVSCIKIHHLVLTPIKAYTRQVTVLECL